MTRQRIIRAVDLFCGAGGTSTGAMKAAHAVNARLDLLAVNHWPTAINSHTLNHPSVRHMCESLDNIRPQTVVPNGHLNVLMASPECTHHSIAAGGRPRNDQSRATAWHICRWAADLTVENIFVENVREFQNWGPLAKTGKPLKRRKGETFQAFIAALRSMGFNVEYRVVNAADYGDPTSRQRLIVLARRGKPVVWPVKSHGADAAQPWRTAREIIDWEMKGKSIFGRKKSLSPNTLRRIAAGLKKFGGVNAEPFLVMLYGTNNARSVDRPAPTVTAGGGHIAVAEPFIVAVNHGTDPSPRGTDGRRAKSVDEPMPTLTTQPGFGVCEPFLTHITHSGKRNQHSVDCPVPTITTAHRGELALVEPFLVKFHGDHRGRNDGDARVHETGKPLPTLDTSNRFGLVEPFMLGQQSCAAPRSVDCPVPTIVTDGAVALVEPFIVKYYGTAGANSVDRPLDTVTTKDRFLLVEPKTNKVVAELDILFRMLQPHELSAAMSFPKDYKFSGNRGDQVKQIGNAVPVELAAAHLGALLS
jgi:DNA (cytosine-5)-methyltransferase 1